jgi:hypothetical protein
MEIDKKIDQNGRFYRICSTRYGGLLVISGSLSPGSPAEAGEPGVIHGLIRLGGLIRGGGSGSDKHSGFLIRISKLINWKMD